MKNTVGLSTTITGWLWEARARQTSGKKCITEMSRLDNDIGDPLGVIFLDEKFEKKDKESVRALFQ